MKMAALILSVFIIGVGFLIRSTVEAQLQEFCVSDVCYIRPDSGGKPWSDAQQICKQFNSTLAIVDTVEHQNSFAQALHHFNLDRNFVWIGARATYGDTSNWIWIDGTPYKQGISMLQGSFSNSYAFVSNETTFVKFNTAQAKTPKPYICKYSSESLDCTNGSQISFVSGQNCYVINGDSLPWFAARNVCLSKGGDLATFNGNVYPLLLRFLSYSTPYWVGLRSSWWNWSNAVTEISKDVTFTLWTYGQPDDASPNCISTNVDNFPTWRDYSCNDSCYFLCQRVNVSMSQSSLLKITSVPAIYRATSPATDLPASNVSTGNTGNNLAIGLGVGLGVGVLIILAIIVVIVVVVFRRKRHSCLQKGTDVHESKRKTSEATDKSFEHYAPIMPSSVPELVADSAVPTPDSAIVYHELSFQKQTQSV